MRSVRIKFSKTGRAIFISHLDVNRMMTRAVRRARLPMWYTEGFNPHPYITFALPLSLGQSSDCEYMDIRIEGGITDDEIMQKLNDSLPDGIKVLSVDKPVHDAKDIEKALYFVKVIFDTEENAAQYYQKSGELVTSESIIAEKLGKKGHRKVMKQINLIDYIYDAKFSVAGKAVNLQTVLAAGNTNNLNPSLLIETIENCVGLKHSQLHIVRKKLIAKNNEAFC